MVIFIRILLVHSFFTTKLLTYQVQKNSQCYLRIMETLI